MALHPALRVAEAEARTYRRVWRGSVVTSFLNPVLYLLAMGVGLGSLVDANLPGGIEGVSYLTFLAPGLLAATAMQTGAGEGSWKVMAGLKWRKTYHAALATPVGIRDLVLGLIAWATVRVIMVSVVFAVVMALFGVTSFGAALAAVAPSVLVGVAMAAMVMAYTARLEDDTGLSTLFRFVVVPMFLFSGTFFPISQLPNWLEWVAYLTPLFHGVEMARAAALGTTPLVAPWISVIYLSTLIVIGTVIGFRLFERRLIT